MFPDSAAPSRRLWKTTFRRLGDQAGPRSSSGLFVRFALPEPSAFITQMSSSVAGSSRVQTMRLSSYDHAGPKLLIPGSPVSWARPVPSAFLTKTSCCPSESLRVNTSRMASAEKTGSCSWSAVLPGSGACPLPSAFMTNSWLMPVRLLVKPTRPGVGDDVVRAASAADESGGITPAAARSTNEASARRRIMPLASPPVALALDVVAGRLAEVGRADDDDLEALRPGFVAAPGTGRDAHNVPLLELDDLVVELHPPTPAHDHVHLLLLPVRVAVGKAIVGWNALVAQAGVLELERLRCQAELQVRRAVEVGPDVGHVLPEVPERERHGRNPTWVP